MSQSQNPQANGKDNTTIIGKRYQMIREVAVSLRSDRNLAHNWKTYIAQDTGIIGNPLCVVKEIPLSANQSQQKAYWDELVTWQQQLGEHPEIPRILAYFAERHYLYVIREYFGGEILQTKLTQRVLQQTEGIQLLADLLEVLEYIQENQLIHANIQPDNIIKLKQSSRYSFLDYDDLKPITIDEDRLVENKIATLVYNTNSFFAPEQAGNQAIASSDFYSLGKTVIYALTRSLSPNWEEEYPGEVESLDPKLRHILNRAISPNVKARYHSVAEIKADLNQIRDISTIINTDLPEESSASLQSTNLGTDRTTSNSLPQKSSSKKGILPIAIGLVAVAGIAVAGELIRPTLRPSILSWQGKQALEKKPQQALDSYQEAISLQEKHVPAWIGRGNALYELERYRAALLAYDKAIALSANNAAAWKGRGDALFRLERFEAALTAYSKSLRLDPKNPEGYNRQGRALYKLERQEEALAAQEKALELKPNYAQALSDRGIVLIGLGKYEDALKSFESAQSSEPLNPEFWQNKALAWQYLGRNKEAYRLYQEALESYNNQLQQNPDDVTTLIDKGNVLTKLQQHQRAVEAYNKAIEVNPNSHLAWLNKGNALFALGSYEQALSSFDRALKIAPESYLTWHNRGSLLRDGMRDYPEAITSYKEATKLNPSFYHAWRDMGLAYSQSGQQYLALKSFDNALEINPEDHQSWVGRGIAYSFIGKIEESIAAFDSAGKINPNDPSVWMNKGYALEDANRTAEACTAYTKVSKINPTFSPAIEAMEKLGCQR